MRLIQRLCRKIVPDFSLVLDWGDKSLPEQQADKCPYPRACVFLGCHGACER